MPGSKFIAVLDACVLYPAALRDFLVTLAKAGLFRAKWTGDIHDEWIRSLLRNRPDLSPELIHRTRHLMDNAVLDALVDPELYRPLIPSLNLPDSGDRHVLAAAIASRADIIVTFNLKDFPQRVLTPCGITAEHPDVFVENLLSTNEERVFGCFEEQISRFKNPPLTKDQLLAALKKDGLSASVAVLSARASKSR